MQLQKWNDLQPLFSEGLLLGNGSSIAVDRRFSYRSLYQSACGTGALQGRVKQLFDRFTTTDFELVLRQLSDANRVNQTLGIAEQNTEKAYQDIRSALVTTVRGVHPQYSEVEGLLSPMAEFMKRFRTVLSLNYDLLVYWAMLVGNAQAGGPWFKDCFLDEGEFRHDYQPLRAPYGVKGATLVFYPHGNLVLARESWGRELKVSVTGSDYLLDTVLARWQTGNMTPLFVSEGDTRQKLAAIRRSSYLNSVYDGVLSNLGQSLVIYGWSASQQDDHIFRQLARANPKRVAVSVYTGDDEWELYCSTIRAQMHGYHLHNCELYFFDAESPGCWIHQPL